MNLKHVMVAANLALLMLAGCEKKSDPKDEAPPAATVVAATSVDNVKVDHPDQFPLATAETQMAASSMSVTGQVQPDVTKVIPVISLASGRIVAIFAHIGDLVHKGQRLFTVQSNDIEQAYSDYRKAVADEKLAKAQMDRAQLLFSKGAISKSAVEIAQDAEDKALVDVEATREHLKVLGATDLNQPSGAINVYAPATGVIIEQNITQASGVKTFDSSPNLFTIANIDDVWIVCDVYENNLANLSVGQNATIHFNAFPDKDVTGRVSEIDPILDPSIRTAKVRVQVRNPGYMKIGMFVTATFRSQKQAPRLVVPSTALVHLHDQDFVYVSKGGGNFTRVHIVGGEMLPAGMQIVQTGLQAGQQVAVNALELQSTVTQ